MEWLQEFLRDNNVEFETQPAPEQLEAARERGDREEGEEGEGEDGDDAPAQEEGIYEI